MRRPFIAGNWKMNLNRADAVALAHGIREAIGDPGSVDVALCPAFIYLDAVGATLAGSPIALGAQDMYHKEKGAFTGEISAAMLLDVGCRCVILGHSERRRILGESNESVCRKVHAALAVKLTPIICVGETLEERELGKTADVVTEQFYGSLAGLTVVQGAEIVIAYEPVWAIGTGKVATPEQAEEVHAVLRQVLQTRFGAEVAAQVRLQYGGSVDAENAAKLLSQKNIDGALVGGASMKVKDFPKIVAAAKP